MTDKESSVHLPGAPNGELRETQLSWLERTLASSTSPYLVVAGHYPVHSICEHGPTQQLIDDVEPLLIKHQVSLWMNGHDHCAEHIDVGNGVQYHTIGSAHVNDGSTAHMHTINPSSLKFHVGENANGGFASLNVSPSGLIINHHDGNGNVLYTASPILPRANFSHV